MPRRPVVITAILGGILGGVALWWPSGPAAAVDARQERREAEVALAPKAGLPLTPSARVVHFEARNARPEARMTVAPATLALGAEPAAVVAEIASLQQLAGEVAAEFSPRQWAAIAAATLHLEAVRQAYEASIATVTQRERGRYQLEVPAYPKAGDALREELRAELRRQLGETSVADVEELLAGVFERRFGGFGVSVQTLEFSTQPGAAEADYQVTRTVRYWNAVEGDARLATRRETHFPGIEDPSGHTWGPFLAVLAAGAGTRGGS